MAKLPRPQAPAMFRAMFPDLTDWLDSPWTAPPFMAAQPVPGRGSRPGRPLRDPGRASRPGPGRGHRGHRRRPDLTIHAERRQEDGGPDRSEFRYGSLTRTVRLPDKIDAKDVTARYEKGILEVSVPVPEAKPEGSRVTIEKAD
jgi:hypothetical protein